MGQEVHMSNFIAQIFLLFIFCGFSLADEPFQEYQNQSDLEICFELPASSLGTTDAGYEPFGFFVWSATDLLLHPKNFKVGQLIGEISNPHDNESHTIHSARGPPLSSPRFQA